MFVRSVMGNQDNVAEWLRRWIANPLLFERVSSNLTGVVLLFETPMQKPHSKNSFGFKALRRVPEFYFLRQVF